MSVPNSVTKVRTKNGKSEVTLISNVDRVNYTIAELTKAALRDVGKVLKKLIAQETPVKTGLLKESWQTWVRKNYSTGEQCLQLGVYNAKQAEAKGKSYAHHVHLVLFGHTATNGNEIPGNNFFEEVVKNNISLIRDIEGQYLSCIEDEQKAIAMAEAEESKAEDE